MLVLLNIMPNALMIMVGLSTARKDSRMIQTRIPPLTKTLVLISVRLASFIVTCLSKWHTNDVTQPVVHRKKINETSK